MDFRRKIDDVFAAVREGHAAGRKCSVLIGAGCSVTADIPTAAGFVDIIKNDHARAYEHAAEKTYAKCMAELAPGVRRDLIAQYVDNARINWAHIALAQLMIHGYIDRVLTTNFDPLVLRACALQGTFPAVYDFAASQRFKPAYIPEPAVFHLHGQHTGFVLMNTEEECQRHAELLKPVFEDAGRGRMWLVVGYSGRNDPVFEHLAKVPQFDYALYWVGYKDDEPSKHLRDALLQPDKYAFYVNGYDADGFFVELARSLECFPPPFVEKPFSHLATVLAPITPFKLPGHEGEIDVLDGTRKMIAQAAEQHEMARPEGEGAAADDLARRERLAESLLLAGKLQQVEELAVGIDSPLSTSLAESVAWARIMQGNILVRRATAETAEAADQLFAAACQKYEAALAIKPDMHEALNNWGSALSDQGESKTGEEADRLFAAAYEKHEAALAIKPDMHEALNNWGCALSDQGESKTGEEADRLFGAACQKYDAALAIKPDMHEALNNWGNALLGQAKSKTGEEADRLFGAACQKYEAALAIKPDMHEALNNWGSALSGQAKSKTGEEADRLFGAACQKYEAALAVKPDMHEALNNWGCALSGQAKSKTGEEADRLFGAVCQKYEAALAIKPDMHEALNNWGNALLGQAKSKTGEEADRLFAAAWQKYEAALAIKPDMHEALNNWGSALLGQAKSKTGEEADRLFAAAWQKYEAALAIKPDDHKALNNWGSALLGQAKSKTGEEADRLFAAAWQKYEAALAIKPDDHKALNNWGSALLQQADSKSPEEAEPLLRQAREKLLAAEALRAGAGSYNLACVAALTVQPEECRRWLETTRQCGRLPSREHLEKDTDLDGVRECEWFKEILEGA